MCTHFNFFRLYIHMYMQIIMCAYSRLHPVISCHDRWLINVNPNMCNCKLAGRNSRNVCMYYSKKLEEVKNHRQSIQIPYSRGALPLGFHRTTFEVPL